MDRARIRQMRPEKTCFYSSMSATLPACCGVSSFANRWCDGRALVQQAHSLCFRHCTYTLGAGMMLPIVNCRGVHEG